MKTQQRLFFFTFPFFSCFVFVSGGGLYACASAEFSPNSVGSRDASTSEVSESSYCEKGAVPNTACVAPSGTTCEIGVCGGEFVVCQSGVWRKAGNVPQTPTCPASEPILQGSCSSCWPQNLVCHYNCDTANGAGSVPLHYTCSLSKWVQIPGVCTTPLDAGIFFDAMIPSDGSVLGDSNADVALDATSD